MKKKRKVLNAHQTSGAALTSSRGVVESIIDETKDDKSSTWEQSVKRSKIARWDEIAKTPPLHI